MNGPRIQQLKVDLADCKQRGMSMVAYYGKLKTLWNEIGGVRGLAVMEGPVDGAKSNNEMEPVEDVEEVVRCMQTQHRL